MSEPTHRILVTGSSGFLGKALVPALARLGHQVRAAGRHQHILPQSVEIAPMSDITQPIDWSALVKDHDVVIHLAAIAHREGVDAVEMDQANRKATSDLAASCKQEGVKRLIFLSSIGAQTAAESATVVTEADTPRPSTAYGKAKLKAEAAIRVSEIEYTILRPTIVYGPDPVANVALLVRLARLPMPLPFGSFNNLRSLLALQNLIAAIVLSLDGDATRNQTFVVCDPAPISLSDMFRVMRRAQGQRPALIPIPPALLRPAFTAAGLSDIWSRFGGNLVVNPQKLLDAGWRPVVTTQEGLAAMMRESTKA